MKALQLKFFAFIQLHACMVALYITTKARAYSLSSITDQKYL